MTEPFGFLRSEWPDVHEAAGQAAASAIPGPRTACFYARRAVELAVGWAFKYDRALKMPYSDNIMSLIHEPTFKAAMGEAVFVKARLIIKRATRPCTGQRPISVQEGVASVRELFHFAYWFARTYARAARPDPGLRVRPGQSARDGARPAQTLAQLQKLEADVRQREQDLSTAARRQRSADAEIERMRAAVADAKKAVEARPDTHDYDEARHAGRRHRPAPAGGGLAAGPAARSGVRGHGHAQRAGQGFVDYVLWGDDGRPLGWSRPSGRAAIADRGSSRPSCTPTAWNEQFGQRPVDLLFERLRDTGSGTTRAIHPASVAGLLQERRAGAAVQRRATRKPLAAAAINDSDRRAALPDFARSAASPRPSSATTSARRCW